IRARHSLILIARALGDTLSPRDPPRPTFGVDPNRVILVRWRSCGMEVASGQRIGQGRFEVLTRLGEGGAGVVYEVKDHQSDARLALKTVRAVGPEALVSLKREFRAAQDI